MSDVNLSGIFLYPIKSAGGIEVASAVVEERGLRFDRRWMLVDADNIFMTQRDFPRMALISPRIDHDALRVNAPDMPSLVIPFDSMTGPGIRVVVWDDTVDALSACSPVNAWFSEFLKTTCTLVWMPDLAVRAVRNDYAVNRFNVSFADAFQFLLISEGSLEDLNVRLENPLPMNRFRPNLVVRGCRPYAEDTWRKIRIGGVTFHVVKSCTRCTVTTVDQRTGIRGIEPLRTLGTYRKRDGKVHFGQNLTNGDMGNVATGQDVEILEHV